MLVQKLHMKLEDYEKKKEQRVRQMRSIADYAMGAFFFLVGVFFFFLRNNSGIGLNNYLGKPDMLDRVLGGMCLLYGAWRIYRGYQKKYFR